MQLTQFYTACGLKCLLCVLSCMTVFGMISEAEGQEELTMDRKYDQFILKSTRLADPRQHPEWLKPLSLMNESKNPSSAIMKRLKSCVLLDLPVPESYDPLPLCLREQDLKKMAFHKDFQLLEEQKGQKPKVKLLKLKPFFRYRLV